MDIMNESLSFVQYLSWNIGPMVWCIIFGITLGAVLHVVTKP